MPSSSKVIVTAANSEFYELVTDTVASIRDKPEGRDIPIVVFDVGLTDADRLVLCRIDKAREASFARCSRRRNRHRHCLSFHDGAA